MKRHKHADLIVVTQRPDGSYEVYVDGTLTASGWWQHPPTPKQMYECFERVSKLHDDIIKAAKRLIDEETKPLIDEATRKAIKKLFPDANWLAMDEDGAAAIYEQKPKRHSVAWNDGEFLTLDSLVNYAPDWRTSLVDLNEEVG